MGRVEELDDALASMLDLTSESILTGDFSAETVEEAASLFEESASSDLEPRSRLKQIEDAMRG